ncbi:MAG TPA: 4-carboxy-4-hydroxy-2-oxoadipate aldolase/oxaloacetate decarboxylase [Ilumatobacter sp.]|nr:4-carboxy-4-hydroxy-2-oxoadipate aldolase/oxaloacetate decarboxylase [Ilumatobacter sp.]
MSHPQRWGKPVVVTSVERADPATVAALGAAGAATVHEAIGRRGYLGAAIQARCPGARVGASAVTVLSHPGDNLMVHAVVEQCQAGDIVVVAHTAPSTHGLFGELLATSLAARGVAGLVTDAGVRDTAELREMGFPVWSAHVSCQGTVKNTAGSVNVPVAIGGVVIHPGDAIVADDDGVVVVPRDEATWAVQQSQARLANEGDKRARLAAGELGLDMYNLRTVLTGLGVTYE